MTGSITRAFKQPYPVSLGWRRDLLTILGIDLLAVGFILLLKPFGLMNITHFDPNIFVLTIAVCCFFVGIFNKLGLPRILPGYFQEEDWSVAKEILFSCWNLLTITFTILLVARGFEVARLSFFTLLVYCFYTIFIGIIPLIGKTMLTQIWLLKGQLKRLQAIHQPILEQAQLPVSITLKSEGTEPPLTFELNELLYIQAQQNYVRIVCQQQDQITERLLRSSLKAIESQLQTDSLVRCHRSNIVNLHHIKKITGNAQGYQLTLNPNIETIPVSRTYSGNVLRKLKQIGLHS